jgi:hypothetical protein
MRDYWLVQYVLSAIGWAYLIVALGALGLALRYAEPGKSKIIAVLLVVALFSILPLQGYWQHLQEQRVADEFQVRFAKAKRLFDERCKTAGERIYRTVEGVEAIQLMKIRPRAGDGVGTDPMYPGAALFSEGGHDKYIASFLRYEKKDAYNPAWRGELGDKPTDLPGYRAVEVLEESDGKLYGYTKIYDAINISPAAYNSPPKMYKSVLQTGKARYGVTYEDLIDPEDRKHWVAGTVLKVIDLQTKEVIAEHTRFLFDTGLGSTGGFRDPWGWAESSAPSCPRIRGRLGSTTRYFVDQVLKPIKGE